MQATEGNDEGGEMMSTSEERKAKQKEGEGHKDAAHALGNERERLVLPHF
jgi:hypothetical protein